MKLKFGLSQVNNHAPKWLINTTALITLLIVAKQGLVNELPVLSAEAKVVTMAWVDYILDALQCVLAIAVIFSGEQKPLKNDQ